MTSPDVLRSRVLGGLAWKGASQIVFQIMRIGVAVSLARLLAPHAYGLASMVLVLASFALVFSDLSLGAALIQRAKLTELDKSTVFWTSVAAGVLFTGLGVVLAPVLAGFYRQPTATPLFVALSFVFLTTAIGTTQSSLLARDLRFRELEVRQMLATVVGSAAAIAAAWNGAGAWSIIVQQLVTSSVSTAMVWRVSDWRPRFAFSLASLRDLGGFGGNVFGQRLLYYAARNTDSLLIGRYIGAVALGTYVIAFNIMLVPATRIGVPVQEVLFPAMSRIQNDRERIAALWLRSNRLVAAASIPAMIGMMIVAPEFVSVVLGAKWATAVPVIRILAWVGVLQALQTLNGDILQACNRAGTQLWFTAVWFVANLIGFVGGIHWGIKGVAVGFAIASTAVAPLSVYLTGRVVGVGLRKFAGTLGGVCQATAAMAVATLAARAALQSSPLQTSVQLAATVAVGAAVYVAACFWRAPEVVNEIRSIRRSGDRPIVPGPLSPAGVPPA